MQLLITDKFYSDQVISQAYRESLSATKLPLGFLTVWCSIAKRLLQSGKPTAKGEKLKELSLIIDARVDDPESPAFKAMEKFGMVKLSETELPPSTVGVDKYEEWYQSYPYRLVNGRKVKVRGKSKVRFFNTIRTDAVFTELMAATSEYTKLCNKLPKDPERFLLNEFWKEYAPEKLVAGYTKAAEEVRDVKTGALDAAGVEKLLNG
jgi:hypothetical protein